MKTIYNRWKKWVLCPKTLQWHISAPAPILAILVLVIIFKAAPSVMESLAQESAINNALSITRTLQKIRDYYTQNIGTKLAEQIRESAHNVRAISQTEAYHLTQLADTGIPVPATFLIEMSNFNTPEDEVKVSLTSPFPFKSRTDRVMDEFQMEAWNKLVANPDTPVTEFTTRNGHRSVRVALADRLLLPNCVGCHNAHPDSPKKDWQLGDVRGVLEIEINVEPWMARARSLSILVVSACFIGFFILVLFNLRFARRIARPMQQVTNAITSLAERKEIDISAEKAGYIEVRDLNNALGLFQHNEAQRQTLEKEVEKLAYYDPLTELPNRASMVRYLSEAIETMAPDKALRLILVKLDKFSEINDTLGYDVGDKVLCSAAARLKDLYPETVIARFNSAEFAIAYVSDKENCSRSQTVKQLPTEIHKTFIVGEYEIQTTASVGAAAIRESTISVGETIARANIALSQAEASDKERLVFYSPELSEELHQRVALIRDLKVAIEKQELQPYFQPQVCLQSGRLVGAEALLRWRKEDGTQISPGEFIPIAERSRLILPIGRKVLGDACRFNKQWQDQGLEPFRVAVNVSGIQFDEDDMVTLTQEVLAKTGLAPECLELEVTESALMSDIDTVIQKLTNLQQLGIELAIDDFGTGYSSLSYLKQLPIDRLKVDQSFVRHLAEDQNDQAIVKTILDLGKSLNLKLLAEGIEDAEASQFLMANGCTEAQGYYYGRPMPAGEFFIFAKKLQKQQKQQKQHS
jgi:diguanylate cyclase (GGDEF)-like protein